VVAFQHQVEGAVAVVGEGAAPGGLQEEERRLLLRLRPLALALLPAGASLARAGLRHGPGVGEGGERGGAGGARQGGTARRPRGEQFRDAVECCLVHDGSPGVDVRRCGDLFRST